LERSLPLVRTWCLCTAEDESGGGILGDNGGEHTGSIIGSIAHERRWHIDHAPHRFVQEAARQPYEDGEIDRLEPKCPPIEAHGQPV
jgi:hypothetical protein